MNIMWRILALLAFLAASPHSWAGYAGHSVGLTWEDVPRTVVLPGDPPPAPTITDFGTSTVLPGIEFNQAAGFDIDVSDGQIRLLVSCQFCGITGFDSVFSDFRIRDAGGDIPRITGVSIGLDSNLGVDPWRVSHDADSVLINLAGLIFDSGHRHVFSDDCADAPPGVCQALGTWVQLFQPELVLNVTFAEAPEPDTAAVLGIGLLALVLTRQKKGTVRPLRRTVRNPQTIGSMLNAHSAATAPNPPAAM